MKAFSTRVSFRSSNLIFCISLYILKSSYSLGMLCIEAKIKIDEQR